MEAGPPNTVEDLEDLSKRWLLERFCEDIHRLSRHLRELGRVSRAEPGFEANFRAICDEQNVLHDYRDMSRFARTFESIAYIVRYKMINNSDWNLDEETNDLFWPYSHWLTIEERTQFDSTYNMIARPLFWITYCWDVKSAVINYRRVCRSTGIANRQTMVQNNHDGYFTVLELCHQIIAETTNLWQFILSYMEALNRWSPAQNFGEPSFFRG